MRPEEALRELWTDLQLAVSSLADPWTRIPPIQKGFYSAGIGLLLILIATRQNRKHDQLWFAVCGVAAMILLGYAAALFTSSNLFGN
jgi:hypothetical protein